MAWIESHQGLERHPKTMKLSLLMGWDLDQTIGKLLRFWWWCLDFTPDGNVSRHSADMAALSVGIPAELGEKFILAMYEARFLDKTSQNQYLIHDWLEYAGKYLRDTKYRHTPSKYMEIKKLYETIINRQLTDKKPRIRRKSAVPTLPTLPTLPTHKDDMSAIAVISYEWLLDWYWKNYPHRNGVKKGNKSETDKNMREYVKIEEFDDLQKSVDNFKLDPDVKRGIGVPDPERFIYSAKTKREPWRDWIYIVVPEGGQPNEKHRLKSFAEQDRDKQQQIRRESQGQAGLSGEDVEIFRGDQPESMGGCGAENALPVGVGSTS